MIVGTAAIHTAIDTKLPLKNWSVLVRLPPGRGISYAIVCAMSKMTITPTSTASTRHHLGRSAATMPSASNTAITGTHGKPLGPGTQSSATATRADR